MNEILCTPFESHEGLTHAKPFSTLPPNAIAEKGIYVVFVLGGPGAGKGTQCANLARDFNIQHLSVGDVLRQERDTPNSEFGELISHNMQAGRIGPMEVTVRLLGRAIETALLKTNSKFFLIDGFPRKMDQLRHFENTVIRARFALFLDSSEQTRLPRLLKRSSIETRDDDTPEIVQKRFHTFNSTCMDVVRQLEQEGRLQRVNADASEDQVYTDVRRTLTDFLHQDGKEDSLYSKSI